MAGLHGLSRGEDYGTVEREEPELLALVTQRLPSCPPGLPLYLLQERDCRALAATVSCGQDIAGDGAFSLAMIADYIDSLTTYGAAFYRNLFWEARSTKVLRTLPHIGSGAALPILQACGAV